MFTLFKNQDFKNITLLTYDIYLSVYMYVCLPACLFVCHFICTT